jgi:hypothetical protein
MCGFSKQIIYLWIGTFSEKVCEGECFVKRRAVGTQFIRNVIISGRIFCFHVLEAFNICLASKGWQSLL